MSSVLITGCDRGIGRMFATQYGPQGYDVHATYCDIANRIGADRNFHHHHQFGVTDSARFDQVAKSLDGAPVDILISNAGVGQAHFVSIYETKCHIVS